MGGGVREAKRRLRIAHGIGEGAAARHDDHRAAGTADERQKRAEAQKAIQDTMRGLSDNSAFDTFERMSQKVDQIEAESEASAELGGELAGDTLQGKFKKLEAASGGGSDMALAELKAKMGLGPMPEQRPALPSGNNDDKH